MIRVLAKNGAALELYNWAGQTPIAIAEELWETEKSASASAEILAAMTAGTELPEVKSAKDTIALMRELLGWPAWTEEQFGKPASATPAAAAPTAAAGGQ
jgi:hypothetical protein